MNNILSFSMMLFIARVCFTQEITPKMIKMINASEIKIDENNGDGVFIAQHKKSKKWGMFQALSEKQIIELIPMEYDSIDFFVNNGQFTGVWIKGKVGIYLSPWAFEKGKLSVPCIYDDYESFVIKREEEDGLGGNYAVDCLYLAIKKDGYWGWINWMTGELKTEIIFDLQKERLPYPDFIQEN